MINQAIFNRKVVIYARVSTEHEAQLSALENQMDWYKPILAAHPEWELIDQYVDEGITGTSAEKRPRFMKMIADAKKHKFDMIITREVSRFARNTVDTLQFTRDLRRWGVEVYFINDGIKTFDGDGELRLTIMASLSQDESRKTSVRVKAGQQTSMQNGTYYGNGNILGYDRIDKKTFVINPEQAKTVRLIYDMYLEGNGLMMIKAELERRGYLTSQGKKEWYATVISHVLKNSFYCGVITYHKEYVPDYLVQKKVKNYGAIEQLQVQGTHEPIVTVEEYERVTNIMKSKTKDVKEKEDGGRNCSGKGLPKDVWGKLLVCSCGHAVNRTHWSGSGGTKKLAYRCRMVSTNGTPENRKKKGLPYEGYCNTPMVQEWKLQMMAQYILQEFLQKKDEVLALANSMLEAHINDTPEPEDNGNDEIIKAKNAEIERLQKRYDQMFDMRADGEISAEMFVSKGNEIQNRLQVLQAEIEELTPIEKEKIPQEFYCEKIELLKFALEQYTKFDESEMFIPDSVIEAFFTKIVIYEDHFEWHLRLAPQSGTVNCSVEGKKNKNPTVLYLNADESPTDEAQRRQLSVIGRTKLWYEFEIPFEEAREYRRSNGQYLRPNQYETITVEVFI